MAAFHLAAQHMHHHLLAVADPEDRHPGAEGRRWWHRCAGRKDRGRPARKDDRLGLKGMKEGIIDPVAGMDFAIHVQLAQPARDQLRHLAAEVDDEKTVVVVLGHAPA